MSENVSGSNISFFEPPPGGDITLRSNDGTSFRAHSILMSLASSVFRDMFSVGVQGDGAIDLAEDAESISLMLEHIYPVKSPTLRSLDTFAKCLRIAQKYDVKGMMDTIDEQLCWGERNEAVLADPVQACALADSFGLHNAAEVAARIADSKVNLRDPKQLAALGNVYPQWKLPIRLIGTQAARATALAEILFTYDDGPMNWFTSSMGDSVASADGNFPLCSSCTKNVSFGSMTVPTWLLRWSMGVYKLALSQDLQALPDEAKVTNPNSVPRLVDYHEDYDYWPMSCRDCVTYVQSHEDYPQWAEQVVKQIQNRILLLQADLSLV